MSCAGMSVITAGLAPQSQAALEHLITGVCCLKPLSSCHMLVQEEATWQESGSEDDAMDDVEEDHEDFGTESPENVQRENDLDAELQGDEMTSEKGIDAAYIYVFLTKYVCEEDMCEGSLAPIMNSELYECNRCGSRSTEADFQRRLYSEE